MGRPDIRQKKWGDETQDKKNGETRRKTKKRVRQDARQNKEMGRQDARQKENRKTRPV